MKRETCPLCERPYRKGEYGTVRRCEHPDCGLHDIPAATGTRTYDNAVKRYGATRTPSECAVESEEQETDEAA